VPPLTTNPAGNAASRAPGRSFANWFALALCLAFFLQGLVLIPYLGVQNDEALFGMAIYQPLTAEYSARILGHSVPTMIMSYIGALKAWIYAPMFRLWPPSPYSLRIPVLLFWHADSLAVLPAGKGHGGRARGAGGCALLAFDPIFLLTNTFDWGRWLCSTCCWWPGVAGGQVLPAGRDDPSGRRFLPARTGAVGQSAVRMDAERPGRGHAGGVPARAGQPAHLAQRRPGGGLLPRGRLAAGGLQPGAAHADAQRQCQLFASELDSKLVQMRLTLDGGSLLGYLVRDEPAPRPGRPAWMLERWS